MITTIAAGVFGLVAVVSWYINRNLLDARVNLSIRPMNALVAAGVCGAIAMASWIVLIHISRRSARES